MFSFILPSIQIILFILCIGNDPFGLPMAIWNNDTGGLAKLYLTHLDSKTIVQVGGPFLYYKMFREFFDTVKFEILTWK